ncbi:MAG: PIN domain-containing protein [Gammaproteobacteria bacterium]|nr:PIN domain-containing protein [Gammaproteobacteria bacterium]
MPGTLVDAGPLIALLQAQDPDHAACVATLKTLRGPLLTTWMPVTEAMHFLQRVPVAQTALLEMIERGALRLLDITADDLPAIRALLEKYRDLPMDFADATLVHVAAREHVTEMFTLDRKDFSVYRLPRGRSLRLV